MSASPAKETEVEQGGPSPDNSDQMDRGDPDAQARDLAFEFEVKEQDRWLPIANGWFPMHSSVSYKCSHASKLLVQRWSAPVGAAYEQQAAVVTRRRLCI
ncbi:hypothetical protein MMC13_006204 [Lambiella insularis]|nr:hypothetical protein [Lambiella insularis]